MVPEGQWEWVEWAEWAEWVVQLLLDRKQNMQRLRWSSRQNKQQQKRYGRKKQKPRKRLKKHPNIQRDGKRLKPRRMKVMPSTRKRISQKLFNFTPKQSRCVQRRSFSTVT